MPRDGRLPEPLRQGIIPVSPEEQESWSAIPSGSEMLGEAGASPYDERAADEFWLRTTAESSVDVNGILGGKPGLKNTTTVTSAQANFTVRLAPGQDVETIRKAVEQLVNEAAPDGADVDLRFDKGTPASVVDPKSAAIQLGSQAFEKVFGREPLLVRGGGTLPIMAAVTERGMPVVLTGVALPESSVHSPNEKLPVEYLTKAYDAARELYLAFADLPRSG
jgi:succinyl-diaminopimelate desuccinylase